MKKLILTCLCLLVVALTTQKATAQFEPTVGDILITAAIEAVELLNSDGVKLAESTLGTVSKFSDIAQSAVKVTTAICRTYSDIKDITQMTDVMLKTLDEYFKGMGYVGKHIALLSPSEMAYLVKMLDYACFAIPAQAKGADRIRGLENIGNGVLKIFPKIVEAATGGASISLKEISDLVKETKQDVNKYYQRTSATNSFIQSFIRNRQVELGLYDQVLNGTTTKELLNRLRKK